MSSPCPGADTWRSIKGDRWHLLTKNVNGDLHACIAAMAELPLASDGAICSSRPRFDIVRPSIVKPEMTVMTGWYV